MRADTYIIIVVRALPDFLRSWSHPISVRPGFRSSGARFSGPARFRVRRERYAAVSCRRAAVGAGFGYYSLSSIFISELRSIELGTVALLCNVLRELFTLLAAPWVAGRFGPLAAISSGGATTFDTTLPILTRVAGPQYAVVAIFHGCVTDFSVPFLVTFFCSI